MDKTREQRKPINLKEGTQLRFIRGLISHLGDSLRFGGRIFFRASMQSDEPHPLNIEDTLVYVHNNMPLLLKADKTGLLQGCIKVFN